MIYIYIIYNRKCWLDLPLNATVPVYNNCNVFLKVLRVPSHVNVVINYQNYPQREQQNNNINDNNNSNNNQTERTNVKNAFNIPADLDVSQIRRELNENWSKKEKIYSHRESNSNSNSNNQMRNQFQTEIHNNNNNVGEQGDINNEYHNIYHSQHNQGGFTQNNETEWGNIFDEIKQNLQNTKLHKQNTFNANNPYIYQERQQQQQQQQQQPQQKQQSNVDPTCK